MSILIAISILSSCQKDFLEKKQDQSLLVPSNLEDFQALLNNNSIMNISPSLSTLASDDIYTTDNGFIGFASQVERNTYIWAKELYEGLSIPDWSTLYKQVFYANIILDGQEKLNPAVNTVQWKTIKGSALFYRALAYYNLLQVFAPAYDPAMASTDAGILLYEHADVNLRPGRSSVEACYQQVIRDLEESLELLPARDSYKSRPTLAAAQAYLARVYLVMGQYEPALKYSTLSLEQNNKLIDYNTLDPAAARPVPPAMPDGNDEAIYYSTFPSYSYTGSAFTYMDSLLYRSYAANDLRKVIFFRDLQGKGQFLFKGTYTGSSSPFAGIATDEVYLMRAECNARLGNAADAMDDLNALLEKRWKKGTFIPFTAATPVEALDLVLTERRKELLMRGLRWSDLRRLNKEERYAVTLKRSINGQNYELPPGDKKYVFPIPDEEIRGSGIEQNIR